MKQKCWVLFILLALSSQCFAERTTKPVIGESCIDTDVIDMGADSYQWDSSWNVEAALYKEWWFFTLIDVESDFAMVFSYNVDDPSKTFGDQSSGIALMLWPSLKNAVANGPIYNATDTYAFDDFTGSTTNADVYIGYDNSLTVIDAQTYHAVGQNADGSVKWWLTYHQSEYPMREIFEIPHVIQLNWLSYMPGAKIEGVVEIEGVKRTVSTSARGYHDHNFGQWPDSLFNWIWAQYSNDQGFAMVIGGYKIPLTDTYIGYVFVRYNGLRIKIGTFCGDTFTFTPSDFQTFDKKKYSTHNVLNASNKEWKIVADYRTQISNLNPAGFGLKLYVFEQISLYTVQLYKTDGAGGWILADTFSGLGFNEWSDTML